MGPPTPVEGPTGAMGSVGTILLMCEGGGSCRELCRESRMVAGLRGAEGRGTVRLGFK